VIGDASEILFLKQKGQGGGKSLGLFYCLILSEVCEGCPVCVPNLCRVCVWYVAGVSIWNLDGYQEVGEMTGRKNHRMGERWKR
jgi:hypothetical protein